ncbi:MAG: nucleotide exchange factor GrpE [Thermodesulfobacteriota bacterium]|nr:nucleotide exchange factor GrpE [Thermodesulfobacteriota bacterium]
MKREKELLREKLIEFQLEIAELGHALREQEQIFQAREKDWYLNLFDVLDAFENLDETIKAKEDCFDKTGRMLSKNIRSIHRKFIRLLKANNIVQIEFHDNKARMDYCKVVDTAESAGLRDETILSVVKNGYIDTQQNTVLRKAEVITVLNNMDHPSGIWSEDKIDQIQGEIDQIQEKNNSGLSSHH